MYKMQLFLGEQIFLWFVFCSTLDFLKKMFLTNKEKEFGGSCRLQRRINDFVHIQVIKTFITIECA